MITVAGFNTAIDRLIQIDTLTSGQVHRASAEQVYPGGKGVHVAQTMAALGERVQLVGLVDAAHRNLVGRRMSERGVLFHGVEVAGELRHCMALRERDGRMTEILGQGPQLSPDERDRLLRDFQRSVDESELVILSGSLPRGFAADTYAALVRLAQSAGKRCLVDASGELLHHALEARPFLIKPNRDEVQVLLGRDIDGIAAAVDALREIAARGVSMPVLSLGADGAVGLDGDGAWHASVELEQVRNAVGSGDCFLAGMAVALRRGQPMREALRLAVACGAANAMETETGYVHPDRVEHLLGRVQVRAWMH
ncbi:1-phosphofructokinase family hexose kinase [Dyella sp. A6]|uniref:1-phosphofructokinase family hexose kinase n=1 Tax=Dyella aluminiiresistens TaxID=3069105 RepID=UPI002E7761E5|nr:1-phosphofructokinase family hexose kinase [Dyella sp. A6]